MANESAARTLSIAFVICLACALTVSVASMAFKTMQEEQQTLTQPRAIVTAASLVEATASPEQLQAAYNAFDVRLVDLVSGAFVEGDGREYNLSMILQSDTASRALGNEEDQVSIKRQEKVAPVYLKHGDDGKLEKLIIPVRGYGMWSTLYGFLALKGDATTVEGIAFYQHAETSGLGGEVDNPQWRALWSGKQAFDGDGKLALAVIKGKVDVNDTLAIHKVDGLAGATLTTRGVDALIRFWLSEKGFGPFLARMRSQGAVVTNTLK